MQHFNKPEDPNRFLTTELYRRQPTNLPGQLNMSYGRPAEGYYALRNPSEKIALLLMAKCYNRRIHVLVYALV